MSTTKSWCSIVKFLVLVCKTYIRVEAAASVYHYKLVQVFKVRTILIFILYTFFRF